MIPPPIYNPLDPMGSISQILWYIDRLLNSFVYTTLAQPDIMLGGKPFMQWLFEETWGLASYTSFTVLILIFGAITLGWMRGVRYAPKAILMVILLGGAGAPLIWMLTGVALNLSKMITENLGLITVPGGPSVANDSMPISDLGAGGAQIVAYGLDMIFLLLQVLLVGLIVLLQLVIGSLLMAALALYPLGEFGRLVGRIALYAWFDCFVIGLPVVAIFRRLSMIISSNSGQDFFSQAWARVGFYGTTIIAIAIVAGVVAFSYTRVTRSMGGTIRSTVDGDVNTHGRDKPVPPVKIDQPVNAGDMNVSIKPSSDGHGGTGISTGLNHIVSQGLVVGAVGAIAPEIPPAVTAAVWSSLKASEAEETHIIPAIRPR